MKIIAIIPARYSYSRFPGKPLADICGRPMLHWVYMAVSGMTDFEEVICAIDDERIREICEEHNMKYLMTRNDHPNHIARIQEVSCSVEADYYFCINGDEPLISEMCISPIIPKDVINQPYFGGAMRTLTDAAQVIDGANIKIAVNRKGECLYMSRSPIPYPKGALDFVYKKYVGVECFNKKALDLFVDTPMGKLEKIEDIDHLRLLENGVPLHFTEVESESISVDVPKDLEYVKEVLSRRKIGGGYKGKRKVISFSKRKEQGECA